MTCQEALELISEHLDKENTPEEEAALQEHLALCPACREVLAAYEEAERGILALEEEPPADFTESVMKRIAAEPVKPQKRRYSFRYGTAAAAAVAVLLLGSLNAGRSFTATKADNTASADMAMQSETADCKTRDTATGDWGAAMPEMAQAPATFSEGAAMEEPSEAMDSSAASGSAMDGSTAGSKQEAASAVVLTVYDPEQEAALEAEFALVFEAPEADSPFAADTAVAWTTIRTVRQALEELGTDVETEISTPDGGAGLDGYSPDNPAVIVLASPQS